MDGSHDAVHGWMTGRIDGKRFTTTTSFTICNLHTLGSPLQATTQSGEQSVICA
jgi:hypothetical protein